MREVKASPDAASRATMQNGRTKFRIVSMYADRLTVWPAILQTARAIVRTQTCRCYGLLHQCLRLGLNTTEVEERFLHVGIEPVGSSPEQLAARIKSDMTYLGKLIKDAGIRGD
jgi:hypothetical protein